MRARYRKNNRGRIGREKAQEMYIYREREKGSRERKGGRRIGGARAGARERERERERESKGER